MVGRFEYTLQCHICAVSCWVTLSICLFSCLLFLAITCKHVIIHTHTHPFNSPFSGTTQVTPYLKGKTNLDFTDARDSGWQWHQLGHMQVCTLLQTDNHTSTPPLFFLLPNQQRQSTEGLLSSIRVEIHDVLQCRHRRTEPWPWAATCII